MWGVYMGGRVELQKACELGAELFSLAQCHYDPALLLEAAHVRSYNWFFMGEFTSAREYFEQAVNLRGY